MMPQRVQVDGLGVVEFPDEMPPQMMAAHIQKHLQTAPAHTPQTRVQALQSILASKNRPQPQKMFGLNDPNSVVGQLKGLAQDALRGVVGPNVLSGDMTVPESARQATAWMRPGEQGPLPLMEGMSPAAWAKLEAATLAKAAPALSTEAKALIKGGSSHIPDLAGLIDQGGGHALYLDRSGNALRVAGDDHAAALVKAGLATEAEAYGPMALAKNKLIRVRVLPGESGFAMQVSHTPTAAQLNALENMLFTKQAPGRAVSSVYDFVRPGSMQHGTAASAEEMMQMLRRIK